jgi:hypothetical protein
MTRSIGASAITLAIIGCSDPVGTPGPLRAVIVGENVERVILVSNDRIDTVTVRVTDGSGNPVAGTAVTWSQNEPDGAITPIEETTTSDGTARAVWRLSGAPGTWKAGVTAEGVDAIEKRFTITSWTIRQLVTSGQHTCAIDTTKSLYCRARNASPDTRFAPVLPGVGVEEIAGSARPFCVRTVDGQVLCADPREPALAFNPLPGPDRRFRAIASEPDNIQVNERAVCGIDTDGVLWCWGRNSIGMLGIGDIEHGFTASEPVAIDVPGGTRFLSLSMAAGAACAVATDRTIWCWGAADGSGVVPQGERGVPRTVSLGSYTAESVTLAQYADAACAMTVQRKTVCWGEEPAAGLPIGTTRGTALAVSGADDVVQLLPSASGFVGVTSTGALVSWGTQFFGHTPYTPFGSATPLHYGNALAGSTAVFHSQDVPYGDACFTGPNGAGTVCGDPILLWDRGVVNPASYTAHFWRGMLPPQ